MVSSADSGSFITSFKMTKKRASAPKKRASKQPEMSEEGVVSDDAVTLLSLPPEILHLILGYVGPIDALFLRFSCRALRPLAAARFEKTMSHLLLDRKSPRAFHDFYTEARALSLPRTGFNGSLRNPLALGRIFRKIGLAPESLVFLEILIKMPDTSDTLLLLLIGMGPGYSELCLLLDCLAARKVSVSPVRNVIDIVMDTMEHTDVVRHLLDLQSVPLDHKWSAIHRLSLKDPRSPFHVAPTTSDEVPKVNYNILLSELFSDADRREADTGKGQREEVIAFLREILDEDPTMTSEKIILACPWSWDRRGDLLTDLDHDMLQMTPREVSLIMQRIYRSAAAGVMSPADFKDFFLNLGLADCQTYLAPLMVESLWPAAFDIQYWDLFDTQLDPPFELRGTIRYLLEQGQEIDWTRLRRVVELTDKAEWEAACIEVLCDDLSVSQLQAGKLLAAINVSAECLGEIVRYRRAAHGSKKNAPQVSWDLYGWFIGLKRTYDDSPDKMIAQLAVYAEMPWKPSVGPGYWNKSFNWLLTQYEPRYRARLAEANKEDSEAEDPDKQWIRFVSDALYEFYDHLWDDGSPLQDFQLREIGIVFSAGKPDEPVRIGNVEPSKLKGLIRFGHEGGEFFESPKAITELVSGMLCRTPGKAVDDVVEAFNNEEGIGLTYLDLATRLLALGGRFGEYFGDGEKEQEQKKKKKTARKNRKKT